MSPRRADVAAALLVALLTALPYAGTVGFEPTYDDHHHILYNPFLGSPANARLLFSLDYVAQGFPDQSRPVMLASLLVDRALFGWDIGWFHLQSVALHALVALLAFVVARRLGFSRAHAATGALLFGLHPACTEAVASVSNREELLVGALGLGALLAARRAALRSAWWLLPAALLFGLALLAKELALALPLLFVTLALHPSWLGPDRVPRRRWLALAAACGPGLGVFLALHLRLGFPGLSIGAGGAPLTLSSARVVASAGWSDLPAVLGLRAARVLFGWPLSAEHDASWLSEAGPAVVGASLTALLLLLTVLLARRRHPGFVAIAWFLCASLPTLSGPWLLNPVADRYLYLPALGTLTVLGALLASRRGVAATLLLLGALSVCAARTADRANVWRDDVALFEDATRHAPSSGRAWQNLGAAYIADGRPAEAVEPLRRAVRRMPDRIAPRMNLARAYLDAGQPERALAPLSVAATMEVPDAERRLREQAFHRWIRVLLELGRADEARRAAARALAADPSDAAARDWARSLGGAARP